MGRPKKYVFKLGDVIGHGWKFVREGRGGAGQRSVWVGCPKCATVVERPLGGILRAGGRKGLRSCGCFHLEGLSQRNRHREPLEAADHEFLLRYKTNARKRGRTFTIPDADIIRLFHDDCGYCGQPPSLVAYARSHSARSILVNGVDRLDNSRGYEPGNVIACCKRCNLMKGTLSAQDFILQIKRQYEFLKHRQRPVVELQPAL